MERIEKQIEALLEELNFEHVIVNDTLLFLHSGAYYKITYINKLKSYVIE